MSKEIKKALECCINGDCSKCPNNDELGSGEIVCMGRLLPKVLNCITDLESKLAEKDSAEQSKYQNVLELTRMCTEKDKQIEQLKEMTDGTIICKWTDAENKVKELEQQLAEKNKEIEKLNNRILISQLQAPKEQILNILGSQCIQYNPDQEKIEFAVERILDIKEEVFGTREMGIIFDIPPVQDAFDVIENKIKQLKEME